jgi:hypothetical protein
MQTLKHRYRPPSIYQQTSDLKQDSYQENPLQLTQVNAVETCRINSGGFMTYGSSGNQTPEVMEQNMLMQKIFKLQDHLGENRPSKPQ